MHWRLPPEVCDGPVMDWGRVVGVVVGLWKCSLQRGWRGLVRHGQMQVMQGWRLVGQRLWSEERERWRWERLVWLLWHVGHGHGDRHRLWP